MIGQGLVCTISKHMLTRNPHALRRCSGGQCDGFDLSIVHHLMPPREAEAKQIPTRMESEAELSSLSGYNNSDDIEHVYKEAYTSIVSRTTHPDLFRAIDIQQDTHSHTLYVVLYISHSIIMKSSSYFTLACSIVSALALGVPSLSSIESVVSSLIPRRAYGVPRTPIQDIAKRAAGDACPAVWFDVSKNLTGEFMKEGNCNDNARAAIRAAFHVRKHLLVQFDEADNLSTGLRRLEHVSWGYWRMRRLSNLSTRVPSSRKQRPRNHCGVSSSESAGIQRICR
jgi:hypothetical protein